MKIYIGPYTHHWTTQSADLWWYKWRYDKYDWEVEEENRDLWDHAYETAAGLWRVVVCRPVNWIKNKIPRTKIIKLDNYDTWSVDHTLALIAYPLLKQLQASKHGAPCTDDEDAPEHLRSTAAPKVEEWETDELHFKRWDWIMNEMVWTFEQLASEDDEQQFYHDGKKEDKVPEGWVWIGGFGDMRGFWVDRPGEEAHHKRISNGLRLFGRYYRALWD
jgi:hypothetical protein